MTHKRTGLLIANNVILCLLGVGVLFAAAYPFGRESVPRVPKGVPFSTTAPDLLVSARAPTIEKDIPAAPAVSLAPAAGLTLPTASPTTPPSSCTPSSDPILKTVVNKANPLSPRTYAPPISSAGGATIHTAAICDYLKMYAGARAQSVTLQVTSSYRSYQTQVSTYNYWVSTSGQAEADRASARAGYSEHQTGLAVDFTEGACRLSDCFATTRSGSWLAQNSWKYGWILRYTPTNVATTGYKSEPWHFRYIGVAAAKQYHESGASSLESFYGVLGGSEYRE